MRLRSFPKQRREPAADAQVDPRLRVVRVNAIHVIALFVGHHFERQLVVIAQEQRPLAGLGNGGVCSRISTIGKRSSMRTAMNNRGISGK